MKLKPDYMRACAITCVWVAVFAAIAAGINHSKDMPFDSELFMSICLIGGTFMAIGVCIMFVPRELTYDANGFSCRMWLQGSHAFTWDKLVAFGSGRSVLLLKFEGRQAIQISGSGFKKKDWNDFLTLLSSTFPEKKCSFWIGPIPIRRKR